MIFISHRGNLYGPNRDIENTEQSIRLAIDQGFECEIDVWFLAGSYWLGHDYPQYKTTLEFLDIYKTSLWVHCKNIDALVRLKDTYHCFFHDKDLYTITSRNVIWGNVDSEIVLDGIVVMPERATKFSFNCKGVCTDFPVLYRKLYDSTR